MDGRPVFPLRFKADLQSWDRDSCCYSPEDHRYRKQTHNTGQICGRTAPPSPRATAVTTFQIALSIVAARWNVSLCYQTTPDTYFQAGFAYNLIKKLVTCTFWQVQMDIRMMRANRVTVELTS